ncbi:Chromosome III, complete sequence, related, partial [Eimeria acervulina]
LLETHLWTPTFILTTVFLCTLIYIPGVMLQVLLAGFKASLFHNIAITIKHWLAQRQAEHDRRRKVTGLIFGEPRLRLLPGPVYHFVDRRILAFLRDKFNPLRHPEVSAQLPPPRRFRVNEDFVAYGSEKKDKDAAPQDKDGGGSHGRGGGAGDDVSIDSNSSGVSFEGDKHRDHVKLVKVSHLINRFSLKFKDMQLEADYQIHQKKSFVKRLVPWYRVIFVFLGLYRIVAFLAEYFIDAYWGTEKHVTPWMCIPTVIVVLGLLGATLSTFGHFFMDRFSFVLSAVVFLMLAEHVTLYSAARMDGILSSVLFPVFTFVILRISFLQAVMWNVLFVSAFTIR